MNETTLNFFNSLRFGEVQTNDNLSVIPLYQSNGKTLKFISLDTALKKDYVEIKEVNSSGSVPDLMLSNLSDYLVFVPQGEELLGAKQNRTVNTSILVNKKTNLTIPVSCVERGRWNFVSNKFTTSDFMIPSELKKKGLFAANYSLKRNLGFRADQSEVWDEIDQISRKAKVVSRTSALYDVHKNYEKNYDKLISKFKLIPEQKGIIAFINGKIQGIEFISRKPVFRKYYKKILKSFALSAILNDEKNFDIKPDFCLSQLQEELAVIKKSEWSKFKSIGLGFDYRLDTRKSVGSVLEVDNNVISLSYYCEN
ncbi:MAG: hypothetical protein N2319_02275 [Candidatus Kapabacteria bacterium]|nr:hypothetical protein [Candidatus Kapabacteria bacterium]